MEASSKPILSLPATLLDWTMLTSLILGLAALFFGKEFFLRVGRGARTVLRNVATIMNVAAHLQKLDRDVGAVLAELRPNGGTSLRDAINRLERTQVEQALARQKSDARIMAVLNYDAVPMFESDAEGRCLWVNRAMLVITGRTDAEMLDHGWTNAIHPEDRPRVRELWEAAIREVRAFEEEFRYARPDGHAVRAYVTARPILASNGDLQGWLGQAAVKHTAEEVKAAAQHLLENGFDGGVPGYVFDERFLGRLGHLLYRRDRS